MDVLRTPLNSDSLGVTVRHIAVILTCIALFASGLIMASWLCDCSYASRAGTLIVICALLSEAWLVLATPNPDNLPFWTDSASHTAARIAIVIVCFGTLVQGYGDILASKILSCR